MVIAIGSDHGGLKLKTDIVNHLKERGIEVLDKGCNSFDSCDYPDYAAAVTDAVVGKDADLGIMYVVQVSVCLWRLTRFTESELHFAVTASVLRQQRNTTMPTYYALVRELQALVLH